MSEVDRDDLADQGAAHVAATVRQLKQRLNSLNVYALKCRYVVRWYRLCAPYTMIWRVFV